MKKRKRSVLAWGLLHDNGELEQFAGSRDRATYQADWMDAQAIVAIKPKIVLVRITEVR